MNRGVLSAIMVLLVTIALVISTANTFSAYKKTHRHVAPAVPACKVCHCGKVNCHAACSEENMCAMRCEGLCNKTSNK